MNFVYGYKIQTEVYKSYSPDCSNCNGNGCSSFKCSAFTSWPSCNQTEGITDWHYKNESCTFTCPNKPICSKPNLDGGFIGLSSKKENPLIDVKWNQKAPNIFYTYDLERIDTYEQIIKWWDIFSLEKEFFNLNTEQFRNIMIHYSSFSTKEIFGNNNTCIIDPLTKKTMDNCSIIKSNSKEGKYVREWFNKQSAQTKDTIIQNYCSNNTNSPDCRCSNRINDPIYKSIKPSNQYNDSCWYSSCSSGNEYSLLESDVVGKQCPSEICQQIYQFINNEDVSINDIKQKIACNFSNPNKPVEPVEPVEPTESFFSKNKYIISISFFIFFLILGVLFIKNNIWIALLFWLISLSIIGLIFYLNIFD